MGRRTGRGRPTGRRWCRRCRRGRTMISGYPSATTRSPAGESAGPAEEVRLVVQGHVGAGGQIDDVDDAAAVPLDLAERRIRDHVHPAADDRRQPSAGHVHVARDARGAEVVRDALVAGREHAAIHAGVAVQGEVDLVAGGAGRDARGEVRTREHDRRLPGGDRSSRATSSPVTIVSTGHSTHGCAVDDSLGEVDQPVRAQPAELGDAAMWSARRGACRGSVEPPRRWRHPTPVRRPGPRCWGWCPPTEPARLHERQPAVGRGRGRLEGVGQALHPRCDRSQTSRRWRAAVGRKLGQAHVVVASAGCWAEYRMPDPSGSQDAPRSGPVFKVSRTGGVGSNGWLVP